MKNIGVIRNVDDLGRIVIPKELRNNLNIKEGNRIEILVSGNSIILRKYTTKCIFCGSAKENIEFDGRKICKKCITKLKTLDDKN